MKIQKKKVIFSQCMKQSFASKMTVWCNFSSTDNRCQENSSHPLTGNLSFPKEYSNINLEGQGLMNCHLHHISLLYTLQVLGP